MAEDDKRGLTWTLRKLRCVKWHQWGRFVAILVLADQALGPVTSMPGSEAIIVVALGALFAPVPTERRGRDE